MKILFYVEPHPIRNEYTHFIDIAKSFSRIAEKVNTIDIKLFANNQTISQLLSQKLISSDKIICPIRTENELFSGYNLDWESFGKQIWAELLESGTEISESYLPILRRIYALFPFDIIIYWGENGAIRLFQQEYSHITAIGMELGCSRPPFFDSIVMDPFGTNGSAVVPKLSIEQIAEIVNYQKLSADKARYFYADNQVLSYEKQFEPLEQKLHQKLKASQKPKVFLPLQLFDDANLIKFSKYSNLNEVLLDVVPKLVKAGYQVIIKPHPAGIHRKGSVNAHNIAYANLSDWLDDIIWCNEPNVNYNNLQLMQLSEFVVTVNSSVGFESLLFDKPCVVLGDAIYKAKGMFPTLEEMLKGNFDIEKYKENANYLRKFFYDAYLLTPSLWNMPNLFIEYILKLHQFYQENKENPFKIAKELFNTHFISALNEKFQSFDVKKVISESKLFKPQIASMNIDDKEVFLTKVSSSLFSISKTESKNQFKRWLVSSLTKPTIREHLFKRINFVDKNYYLGHKDVKESGSDPVEHYSHFGIIEQRTPNKHIAAGTSLSEIIEIFVEYFDLIEHKKLKDTVEVDPNKNEQLVYLQQELSKNTNRIVVVAHLYYKHLVSELLERIKYIKEPFDFIVTLPDWGYDEIIKMVKSEYPDALFYKSLNRGRDIGPFIDILPLLLEKEYDCALKLHTKNGFFIAGELISDYSQIWRNDLLNSLLGGDEKVKDIITAFKYEPNLNMVGTSPFYLPIEKNPYSDEGDFAKNILGEEFNLKNKGFFAGTMFWFRPKALAALFNNRDNFDFLEETGAADGELAHILERLFGHLATHNNGIVAGVEAKSEADIKYYLNTNSLGILKYVEERKRSNIQKAKDLLIEKYSNGRNF